VPPLEGSASATCRSVRWGFHNYIQRLHFTNRSAMRAVYKYLRGPHSTVEKCTD
jgi:hypothetical protein